MALLFFSKHAYGIDITHKLPFKPVAVLEGIGKAKDGDGILFGKVEVRLQGIAAPEYNRRQKDKGGAASTENLSQIVDGHNIKCYLDGTTALRRAVGICYRNETELNLYQVETGNARDCPSYSNGRYEFAETVAIAAGKNLSVIYELPSYCTKDN